MPPHNTSYTIRKLASPTDAELEELRQVFDVAFTSERAFRAVVGPGEYDALLSALNRSQLVAGRLAGSIYVAEDDEDKRIIGGIVWFGPGREMHDSDDQRTLALAPLVEQMPADAREWQTSVMPAIGVFKMAAFGDAARTHWYLQRVGVLPEWQGKGVGTALIEEVRQKAGGLGIALQAVEPQSVSYYERLGFQNRGRLELDAPFGDFSVTALLWEP